MRWLPLTSFTPPALSQRSVVSDPLCPCTTTNAIGYSHVVAQRALNGRLHRLAANLVVLLGGGLCCPLNELDILLTGVHGDLGLELGEEALNDDALEELDVAALILSELVDRRAGRREEVLEVLFALLEQLQTGLVGERRLSTVCLVV